uniref:Uncharacterized protein n=1 Tax=Megaselia scalaris TaxID=36166 RepID=T1H0U7_MEGSC
MVGSSGERHQTKSTTKLETISQKPRCMGKSSSSSGRAVACASCKSFSIWICHSRSILTSGGNKAGMATKSKFGSPTNFLANQRKGFSKL